MQPDPKSCITFAAPSPDATDRFAHALAPFLTAGDVLLLDGPVGAGKTHFARAVIQELLRRCDRVEDVPSPTYTLVQDYQTDTLRIVHADLYRLGSVDELGELGLDDGFGAALSLIEWPDRLGGLYPKQALLIRMFPVSDTPDARVIVACGPVDHWGARLAQLCHVTGAACGTLAAQ